MRKPQKICFQFIEKISAANCDARCTAMCTQIMIRYDCALITMING